MPEQSEMQRRPCDLRRPRTEMRSGQPAARPRWKLLAAPLLLVAVTVACYANSFTGPFVYDGVPYVLENASLEQLCPWRMTLGRSRPVSYYSFALNYAANQALGARGGGFDVRLFHATNLAIHLVAGLALYGIAWRTLTRSPRLCRHYGRTGRGLALAIAALWLVHPLQTQSVTYIYQRQESLMGMLFLVTLYCAARGLEAAHAGFGKRAARGWNAGAVVCCALGMGTKEVMAAAPLLVLWYDRAFWAASWREIWQRRKGLYLALASTWGILAWLMLANRADYTEAKLLDVAGLTPWQYARSQPGVLCHYLAQCFWPTGLCLDYGWPVAKSAGQIVPPALLIGSLVLGTLWAMRSRPAWGFLGGWFFLILAPTSTIVPVNDLAFDHRMYLPLAAVATAVVVGGYELWKLVLGRSTAWLPAGVAATAVLLLCGSTYQRNADYRSDVAIWQDTVHKRPENLRAYVWLSSALVAEGAFRDAEHVADQGLNLGAAGAQAAARLAKLHFNRARAHQELGEMEAALRDYTAAVRLDPGHVEALHNRAMLLGRRKQFAASIADFLAAEKLAPNYAGLFNNCGVTYRNAGQFPQAIEQLTRAIELEPTAPSPRLNRALAYAQAGQPELARADALEYQRLGGAPDPRAKRILAGASGAGGADR